MSACNVFLKLENEFSKDKNNARLQNYLKKLIYLFSFLRSPYVKGVSYRPARVRRIHPRTLTSPLP